MINKKFKFVVGPGKVDWGLNGKYHTVSCKLLVSNVLVLGQVVGYWLFTVIDVFTQNKNTSVSCTKGYD